MEVPPSGCHQGGEVRREEGARGHSISIFSTRRGAVVAGKVAINSPNIALIDKSIPNPQKKVGWQDKIWRDSDSKKNQEQCHVHVRFDLSCFNGCRWRVLFCERRKAKKEKRSSRATSFWLSVFDEHLGGLNTTIYRLESISVLERFAPTALT